MLIGNYTIPSTEIAPTLNYGDLDSFEELATGNFLLDSKVYLPIMNAWSPIKEFRFYCYKPSVGRVVDLVTDPATYWGSYINKFVIGEEQKPDCSNSSPCQIQHGLRALPNDQSLLLNTVNRVGWTGMTQRLYEGAFYNFGYHHILHIESAGGNSRHECDDMTVPGPSDLTGTDVNPYFAGTWKFYVR